MSVRRMPDPEYRLARQHRYHSGAASYFSERGGCVNALMDVCFCDRDLAAGHRARLFGIAPAALAASAAPLVPQLRQCTARRRGRIEGVERSAAPMVLVERAFGDR